MNEIIKLIIAQIMGTIAPNLKDDAIKEEIETKLSGDLQGQLEGLSEEQLTKLSESLSPFKSFLDKRTSGAISKRDKHWEGELAKKIETEVSRRKPLDDIKSIETELERTDLSAERREFLDFKLLSLKEKEAALKEKEELQKAQFEKLTASELARAREKYGKGLGEQATDELFSVFGADIEQNNKLITFIDAISAVSKNNAFGEFEKKHGFQPGNGTGDQSKMTGNTTDEVLSSALEGFEL